MRTRNDTVLTLAKDIAVRDNYTWQHHPDWRQALKQVKYTNEAEATVAFVEKSMKDFAWKPEETKNEKA